MSDKLRIAVLGIDHPHGMGWRESLELVEDAIEITALMPAFDGALSSLEERYAKIPRFDTVEALLNDAADLFEGALVCLPNNTGPDAVVALANAGKHILLEKPGAANAADARRMAQAVRGAKVAFQNGFMWRYDELTNRLRDMCREGRFGKLISVEMTYATSNVSRRNPDHYLFDAEQSGGGFFNWLACHHIDLLLYMCGEAITGVTARVGVFGGIESEVEDGGSALLDLSGGGLATFTGGYWHPRWMNDVRWTLRGTERWVHWDPGRAGTGGAIDIHGPQPQFMAMDETFELPPDEVGGYGGQKMVDLLRDWIRCTREGDDCRSTPESTTATLEILDAICNASENGQRVECEIKAV